jgi:hypothetical protein
VALFYKTVKLWPHLFQLSRAPAPTCSYSATLHNTIASKKNIVERRGAARATVVGLRYSAEQEPAEAPPDMP